MSDSEKDGSEFGKSRGRILELNGEARSVSEWARLLGIEVHTLMMRLERGWPLERALGRGSRRYRWRGPEKNHARLASGRSGLDGGSVGVDRASGLGWSECLVLELGLLVGPVLSPADLGRVAEEAAPGMWRSLTDDRRLVLDRQRYGLEVPPGWDLSERDADGNYTLVRSGAFSEALAWLLVEEIV